MPPVPLKGRLRLKSSLFVWIGVKDEVEEMKIGIALKHRSFSFGEGGGGWGLLTKELKVKVCPSLCSGQTVQ